MWSSLMNVHWNLHNTDTTGTLPTCPYYRGVLGSEVVQATLLNQRGLPALLKARVYIKEHTQTSLSGFDVTAVSVVGRLVST